MADGWWGEVSGILGYLEQPLKTVKTPDFGTVVSMILNYMQTARGSSIYPYHLQFLLSVTLSMYLGVE